MKKNIRIRYDKYRELRRMVAKYGIPEAVRIMNEDTVKAIAMLKSIGYGADYAHFYTEKEVQEIVDHNYIMKGDYHKNYSNIVREHKRRCICR